MEQRLIFGSAEAKQIIQNDETAARHKRGELNRCELIEMSAVSHAALVRMMNQGELPTRDFMARLIDRWEMACCEYLGIEYEHGTASDYGHAALEDEILGVYGNQKSDC